MEYQDFINKLNSKIIKCINFYIKDYAHYKNCRIFHQTDSLCNGKKISIIVCQLAEENYEKVSFWRVFDETYKLFDMGKKGKFTLKQIWDRVCITEIEYLKNL